MFKGNSGILRIPAGKIGGSLREIREIHHHQPLRILLLMVQKSEGQPLGCKKNLVNHGMFTISTGARMSSINCIKHQSYNMFASNKNCFSAQNIFHLLQSLTLQSITTPTKTLYKTHVYSNFLVAARTKHLVTSTTINPEAWNIRVQKDWRVIHGIQTRTCHSKKGKYCVNGENTNTNYPVILRILRFFRSSFTKRKYIICGSIYSFPQNHWVAA